jgi:hypothetical protein
MSKAPRLFLILLALAGCAETPQAPPPPDPAPAASPEPASAIATLEPYQVFRRALFAARAPDTTACVSRQASRNNLARTFVIGDLASINQQYPAVPLAVEPERAVFAMMSLLNSDDTQPQWLVTAEDITVGNTLVELRNGGTASEDIARFERIWEAIGSCNAVP